MVANKSTKVEISLSVLLKTSLRCCHRITYKNNNNNNTHICEYILFTYIIIIVYLHFFININILKLLYSVLGFVMKPKNVLYNLL